MLQVMDRFLASPTQRQDGADECHSVTMMENKCTAVALSLSSKVALAWFYLFDLSVVLVSGLDEEVLATTFWAARGWGR